MQYVARQSLAIDPDATDWLFVCYDEWILPSESIVAHAAMVEGATLEHDSVSVGPVICNGTTWNHVYAVQIKPLPGASEIVVTHRVTTSNPGAVDLGRIHMDHTIRINVEDQ